MRQRTKREPVKASNVFLCCEKEFSPMEMKAHLMDVHKLTEFKGQRSMLMHLDCADSYSTKWEWKIGDVTFHQETVNPRQKGDAMGEDF